MLVLEALLLLALPLLLTLQKFVVLPELADSNHQLLRLPKSLLQKITVACFILSLGVSLIVSTPSKADLHGQSNRLYRPGVFPNVAAQRLAHLSVG